MRERALCGARIRANLGGQGIRLTPDDGALLWAAVEAGRERIVAEARRAGRHESLEACAADALVALAGSGSGPRALVQVRVDHAALVRGEIRDGEVCDIPGVGPVPVGVARRLASDSILGVVVTDGADLRTVAYRGRTIPVRLRRALEARDPTCVVPACDVRKGLEIDHRVPFASGGETSLENCQRLCKWHHDQKSRQGWRLGGGPGRWTWEPPDDLLPDEELPLPP